MERKAPMQFDPEHGRWYVELLGTNYDFHCGEHVEIYMGGQPVVCRFELDLDWYVILKDASFNLRPSAQYMVNVNF